MQIFCFWGYICFYCCHIEHQARFNQVLHIESHCIIGLISSTPNASPECWLPWPENQSPCQRFPAWESYLSLQSDRAGMPGAGTQGVHCACGGTEAWTEVRQHYHICCNEVQWMHFQRDIDSYSMDLSCTARRRASSIASGVFSFHSLRLQKLGWPPHYVQGNVVQPFLCSCLNSP